VNSLLHSLSQVCILADIAVFSSILTTRPTSAGSHPGFAALAGTHTAFAEFAPTLAGTHSGFAALASTHASFLEFAGTDSGFPALAGTHCGFAEFAPTLAATHCGFAAFAGIHPGFAEFAQTLADSLVDLLSCMASRDSLVDGQTWGYALWLR
jgi:hypothetical protein